MTILLTCLAVLALLLWAVRPQQPSTFAERLALGNAFNRTRPNKGD